MTLEHGRGADKDAAQADHPCGGRGLPAAVLRFLRVIASHAAALPAYHPAPYVACLNRQRDGAYLRPYTGFGATDITIVQVRVSGRLYTISGFFYPSAAVASSALYNLDGASREIFAGQARNVLLMVSPNRDRAEWYPRIKPCLAASAR